MSEAGRAFTPGPSPTLRARGDGMRELIDRDGFDRELAAEDRFDEHREAVGEDALRVGLQLFEREPAVLLEEVDLGRLAVVGDDLGVWHPGDEVALDELDPARGPR